MVVFEAIEKKWQKTWEKAELGEAAASKKPKFFMVFAYPGISGYLHVGHMRGFSYTDMICRYKRMKGFNVLFPVGTHASGNHAIAFAKKIKNKDKKWISYLRDNGCPSSLIPKLIKPEAIIEYFNNIYVKEYWRKFGFLADYKRFICTVTPDYNKFIEWQFKKLYQNNLLTQKPYFATFCPECGPVAVDPSETDISRGGNAEKQEFTLLKFKFGDAFIVAATLRPDTTFGQTNLWVDPHTIYVRAEVDDEIWILSKEAADKLGYQKDSIKVIGKIKGKEIIGKYALAPGVEREIVILPSKFCNPDIGSGIVTSVPSDAPWDYIALKELQGNKKECEKYKLDFNKVKAIKPIPIIQCRDSIQLAVDLCEKRGIKSQKETAIIDELTRDIYKQEFHTGVMLGSCKKYSGMRVEEAKELIKQELVESRRADILHDLSEEVVCRCGEKVIIKRIDDQWFIRYSDNVLTEKSKAHARTMKVYPKEYQKNLPSVLDWFMDRACARLGSWMGTKLPFDKKWTVEPISDSTLYPAYYIVSKYVNDKTIKVGQLTEEFFDFVFLNKGRAEDVAKAAKLKPVILKEIQSDFSYWYPLDINLGGKEHQTVHFPVFIMNHAGILGEKFWPKGIFVNHWIIGSGGKISKSKGGAMPIPGAIKKFSVDGIRLYYAHISSPHSDVEWSDDLVFNYKTTLEKIYSLVESLFFCKTTKNAAIDKWIISKANSLLEKISPAMEKLDLREAANLIFFNFYELLRWYQRRGGCNKSALREVIGIFAKVMCPFTPHIAEEIWHAIGNKTLVSVELWPVYSGSRISFENESMEDMIQTLIEDIRAVLKLSKISSPKKITLFIAPGWKFNLCREVKKQLGITKNVGEIVREVMQDENLRKNAKDVNKIIMSFIKNPSKLPEIVATAGDEFDYLVSAKGFLKEEFDIPVSIIKANDTDEIKAMQAMPGKPAILVE